MSDTLSRVQELAGFTLDDIEHSEAKPCTRGGVVIHIDETVELFNLLEANARPWNHRLRIALSSWILHLVKEGKIDGEFQVVSEKQHMSPHR